MGQCLAPADKKKKSGSSGDDRNDAEANYRGFNSGKQPINDKNDLIIGKDTILNVRRNEKLSDFYKVDEEILGEGAFGKVQRCRHRASGQTRAVKTLNKFTMDEREKTRLQYEIEILKKLEHPNIVKLYEVFEDKDYIYIVTELCTGGELFDVILEKQCFNEKDAAGIIK